MVLRTKQFAQGQDGGDGTGGRREGKAGLRTAGGLVTRASPTQCFSPLLPVFGAQSRPQILTPLGNICSK